jgi:hypothetical protein
VDARQLIGSKIGASVGRNAVVEIPGAGGGKESITEDNTVAEGRVSLMPV